MVIFSQTPLNEQSLPPTFVGGDARALGKKPGPPVRRKEGPWVPSYGCAVGTLFGTCRLAGKPLVPEVSCGTSSPTPSSF